LQAAAKSARVLMTDFSAAQIGPAERSWRISSAKARGPARRRRMAL